jgi:hypothetical protein
MSVNIPKTSLPSQPPTWGLKLYLDFSLGYKEILLQHEKPNRPTSTKHHQPSDLSTVRCWSKVSKALITCIGDACMLLDGHLAGVSDDIGVLLTAYRLWASQI